MIFAAHIPFAAFDRINRQSNRRRRLMEDNMKRELDDEQLDNVAGGAG